MSERDLTSGLSIRMIDDINSALHILISGEFRGRRVNVEIPLQTIYSEKALGRALLSHFGKDYMPVRNFIFSQLQTIESRAIQFAPLLRMKMAYLVNQILAIPTMTSFADFHRAKIYYERTEIDGKVYGDDMVYLEIKLLQNKLRSGTVEISTSELSKLLARLPISIVTIDLEGVAYQALKIDPHDLKLWRERGIKMQLPPPKAEEDIAEQLKKSYQEQGGLL